MKGVIEIKNKYKIDGNTVIIYFKEKNLGDLHTLVSIESLDKLLKFNVSWHGAMRYRDNRCYVKCTEYLGIVDGKPRYRTLYLHRFLTDCHNKELVVDHINHNMLDNRLENLRITTQKENSRNRTKENYNGTTGVRNVSYSKKTNQYLVQFQVNGKNKCLGKFQSLDEAEKLAVKLREELYT